MRFSGVRLSAIAALFGAGLLSSPSSAETSIPATKPFAPPPVHPTDKTLVRPFSVDMLGATDTQALLKLGSRSSPRDFDYGVLDLATGCIVETYPSFKRVEKLIHPESGSPFDRARNAPAEQTKQAARALGDVAVQDELRQYLALRSRFGSRKDKEPIYSGDFAWSADGSKILATVAETPFRSRDGGRTWTELDTNMSREPYVTRDGRFAFYQRCGDPTVHNYSCLKAQEIAIVDLDGTQKPRIVQAGRGMIEGLDPTGQKLVFVRDDEPLKVVVTHLDPATGSFARVFAIPAPVLEKNTFFTIDPSRDGKFGTFFHWNSKRGDPNLMATVAVVNMTDGHVVFQQKQPFVGTDVDEEGRLAWGTVNLVRSFGTSPKGVVKDAGAGDKIGWAPGGRLLVFETPKGAAEKQTLGDAACKVVKIVRVP